MSELQIKEFLLKNSFLEALKLSSLTSERCSRNWVNNVLLHKEQNMLFILVQSSDKHVTACTLFDVSLGQWRVYSSKHQILNIFQSSRFVLVVTVDCWMFSLLPFIHSHILYFFVLCWCATALVISLVIDHSSGGTPASLFSLETWL